MTFTSDRGATLAAVLRYEFHGILHFELHFVADGDPAGQVRTQRVASHQIYSNPQPGDRVVIQSLMGMVHQVALETRGAETPTPMAPSNEHGGARPVNS